MTQHKSSTQVNREICTEWMKYSWDSISQNKLSELFLPGSHDTSSHVYNYYRKVNVTNLGKLPVNILNILTFGALKTNIDLWGLSTPYTVFDQLSNGLRYLDMRITMDLRGSLYSHHTFATIPLINFLSDIKSFVELYPYEKIYIYAKIDTLNDPQNIFTEAGDLVNSLLAPYCVKIANGNPTLQEMQDNNKSIRFVLESANTYLDLTKYDYIQSDHEFNNIWCGTPENISIDEAISYKLQYLTTNYNSAIGNTEAQPYIQLAYTITPSNSMVKQSLVGRYLKIPRVYTSLQTVAEQMQEPETMIPFFIETLSVPCIVTFDFPFDTSIQTVINLNFPSNKIPFMS